MSILSMNPFSLFTLFPRLGIRSSIDEGFIYYLTAPAKDLFQYLDRKGHRMGRIAAAYSGYALINSASGFLMRWYMPCTLPNLSMIG